MKTNPFHINATSAAYEQGRRDGLEGVQPTSKDVNYRAGYESGWTVAFRANESDRRQNGV